MSVDISVRWGGPGDAGASSTYKVERSLDLTSWSTLAASQAATSPYVSPASTLDGNASYGATTIDLADGSSFSASGYGWLDGEALIQWTGKSTNQLTGVTWHSGYGTYASGSAVVEAHESYSDLAVTPTNNAVAYRITHTDASGRTSAPAYLWYYYPPAPESSGHCVVVVVVGQDIGVARQASVSVGAQLSVDDQFDEAHGAQLDQAGGDNTETTNAMGLAFFQCWKNSARSDAGGAADPYTFTVDDLEITVSTVPDRDWILLSQVADSG